MRKLVTLALVSATCTLINTTTFASVSGTQQGAIALQKTLSPALSTMEGVNGSGIGACDPVTGQIADLGEHADFVHCLRVNTTTEAATEALQTLYPIGKKINGVFVSVENVGDIHAFPRATSGN